MERKVDVERRYRLVPRMLFANVLDAVNRRSWKLSRNYRRKREVGNLGARCIHTETRVRQKRKDLTPRRSRCLFLSLFDPSGIEARQNFFSDVTASRENGERYFSLLLKSLPFYPISIDRANYSARRFSYLFLAKIFFVLDNFERWNVDRNDNRDTNSIDILYRKIKGLKTCLGYKASARLQRLWKYARRRYYARESRLAQIHSETGKSRDWAKRETSSCTAPAALSAIDFSLADRPTCHSPCDCRAAKHRLSFAVRFGFSANASCD